MATEKVTPKQILEELEGLEAARWPEVLDFISFLKGRRATRGGRTRPQLFTAKDLLQSELVGLWSDREECSDSVSFARRLRWEAEHRRQDTDDNDNDTD